MTVNLNKLFPFLGMRGKLLVAFVGLSLGPLAVLAAYNGRAASEALRATGADQLRLQLLSNVGHIESYLALVDSNAKMFARWVQESGALDGGEIDAEGRAKVEQLFYHFAWMRPDYYQIRLLCERGHEQVRINRHGDRLEIVPLEALQDKSDRYYFKDAITAPEEATYFSPLDLNVERGEVEVPQQLVFRVAHKTRDRQGQVRGLVVMNVFAREILDRLKVLQPDPQAEVLFVGDAGRFVREDCSAGDCAYTFGQIQEHLASFDASVVTALLSNETGVMIEGPDRFISFAPIRLGGSTAEPRWHLAIIYSKQRVLGPVIHMRQLAYVFGAVVATLALVLAGVATRTLTTPIHNILQFVQGVAVGDFRRNLTVETRDEIEELADAVRHTANALEEAQRRLVGWNEELQSEVARKVNEIETLLETKQDMEQQLRRADRLASLGMLSTSLAHEVGNPLAAIKTVIQVHLREPAASEPTHAALEIVLAEIDRLAEILERVTGFVRPVRAQPAPVTLGDVFRRVAFLVEREARKKNVSLLLEGNAVDLPIVVEGQKLEQVLLNLIVNALQAMDQPGRISVYVQRSHGGIGIIVSDTGPGIPDAIRGRVFDPFFTTKLDGTGLGLSIVRQIVSEMHGDIQLQCPGTGGTCVLIEIPIEHQASEIHEVGP